MKFEINNYTYVFPYVAKINYKYFDTIDNEKIIKYKDLEIPVDIRFRKNNNQVIILTHKNDNIDFLNCKIKLQSKNINFVNELKPSMIIDYFNITKIICDIKNIKGDIKWFQNLLRIFLMKNLYQ